MTIIIIFIIVLLTRDITHVKNFVNACPKN